MLDYASQEKTSLTRIMLDNMVVPLPDGHVDVSMLKEAVKLINGRFETEVHYLLYALGLGRLIFIPLNFLHTTIYVPLSLIIVIANVQDPVFETFTMEIFVHGNL